MRIYALFFLLCGVFALHAHLGSETDFEAVDEDKAIYDLKSGNLSSDEDPVFVAFVKNTDDCLMLPQTYGDAVLDFVRIIRNDDKWLGVLRLRLAIKGLCRKITNSCNVRSAHIPEVYAMMVYLAEKFPINERHRLLFFMNKLDGLREKQENIEHKAFLDAEKEADKQKTAEDKVSGSGSDTTARAEADERERKTRVSRAKTVRQKTLTSKDSSADAAELSNHQKSVSPKKTRGSSQKAGSVAADTSGGYTASEPEVRQDRFEHPHEVLMFSTENLPGSGNVVSGTQDTVAQEAAQN